MLFGLRSGIVGDLLSSVSYLRSKTGGSRGKRARRGAFVARRKRKPRGARRKNAELAEKLEKSELRPLSKTIP
jgi:hypothetical protein